jgi:serine/threonine protein kinase
MAGPIAFGRYVLLDQLATGGMAEIFLARDTAGGASKTCVIKRVLPHLVEYPDFVQMFLDEARIAARLHHPGIVQILDLGRQGDDYFFAMEYLAGEDMAAVNWRCRQTRRPLPVEVAMRIASLAADALHHAHELAGEDGRPLHIVHRDVSPSNLFVTYDGLVKVLDFGIARAEQRLIETRTGRIKGKAGYLAPEQARGRPVDRRADVWALGVCLHEMIRGETLFSQETWLATLDAVTTAPIPTLGELRPEVPPALDALMRRVLEREVERRLDTALALHHALEEILAGARPRPDLGAFLQTVFGAERAAARIHLSAMVAAVPAERVATEDILLPADFGLERTPSQQSPGEALAPPDATPVVAPTQPHRITEILSPTTDPEGTPMPSRPITEPGESSFTRPSAEASFNPPWATRPWWVLGAAGGIVTGLVVLALLGWPRMQTERSPPASATNRTPAAERATPPASPAAHLAERAQPAIIPPADATPADSEPAPKHTDTRERAKPRIKEERRHAKEVASAAPTGYLSVDANEPMNVTVDGQPMGTAPVKRVRLAAGEHRVHLENKLLGLSRTVRLVLKPGEDLSHQETFSKGKLNVSTQPWADVFVDGKKLGTTPLAARELWEGHHEVRLVGPQSEKTVTVDVVAGQTAVIREKLP